MSRDDDDREIEEFIVKYQRDSQRPPAPQETKASVTWRDPELRDIALPIIADLKGLSRSEVSVMVSASLSKREERRDFFALIGSETNMDVVIEAAAYTLARVYARRLGSPPPAPLRGLVLGVPSGRYSGETPKEETINSPYFRLPSVPPVMPVTRSRKKTV